MMPMPPEERVIAVITSVLGCARAQVRAAAALYDLPGFDSVALMTIVERLESDLGTEIPAEWIVPEAFTSVGSLAALLEAAAARPGVAGGRA
jgi:acyl carrier protein